MTTAGTVSGGITALMSDGRSLRKYERLDEVSETLVAVAGVADPEKPVSLDTLIEQFSPEMTLQTARPAWLMPSIVLAIVAAAHGPVALDATRAWADASHIIELGEQLRAIRWAPLLRAARVHTGKHRDVSSPPDHTARRRRLRRVAWLLRTRSPGSCSRRWRRTASASGSIGRVVRRIARGRLNRLSQVMRRRGLLAMTAVRLVPLAPFAVVNIVGRRHSHSLPCISSSAARSASCRAR